MRRPRRLFTSAWVALVTVAGSALTAVALSTAAAPPAFASVPAGIVPSATATVESGSPATNFCCGANSTDLLSSPSSYRAYLQFPVADYVPSDATITAVTLNWYNKTGSLTGGVEVHGSGAASFNERTLTWNNQNYNSTVIATSSTPAANSNVAVTIPTADVTPGTDVVFVLRSTTTGVIDHIASEWSGNGPTLSITYTASPVYKAVSDGSGPLGTYTDSGNTNTNHGGADPLKTSPSTYYAWLKFETSFCNAGGGAPDCVPADATVNSATLTWYNETSGEASVDVHDAASNAWVPGSGGNTGDTTCHSSTPACLVYSNQSSDYSATVDSTWTPGGSSQNVTASTSVAAGSIDVANGLASYVLKGTTSGLIDSVAYNTTHPPTLTVAFTESPTATQPSGLCGGVPAAPWNGGNAGPDDTAQPSKVMIIFEENATQADIIGNVNAPYINNTIKGDCTYLSNFTSRASGGHSLANYLEATSSTNFEGSGMPGNSAGGSSNTECSNGCTSSAGGACIAGQTAPCWTIGTPDVLPGAAENTTNGYFPANGNTDNNLFTAEGSSGWKAYAESMPSACSIVNGGSDAAGTAYAPRHVPALYWTALNGGNTFSGNNCGAGTTMASNAIALASTTDQTGGYTAGNLYSDVTAGTLPALSTVTPNLCDDMHDDCHANGDSFSATCPGGTGTSKMCIGDQWLAGILPMITSGPDYQSGNLAIVIVWDEGGTVAQGTSGWPYTCANQSTTCVAAFVLARENSAVSHTDSAAYDDFSISETASEFTINTDNFSSNLFGKDIGCGQCGYP